MIKNSKKKKVLKVR